MNSQIYLVGSLRHKTFLSKKREVRFFVFAGPTYNQRIYLSHLVKLISKVKPVAKQSNHYSAITTLNL